MYFIIFNVFVRLGFTHTDNVKIIEIETRISNYINYHQWDMITHPCPNFNSSLTEPPLKLGHVWVKKIPLFYLGAITYLCPNLAAGSGYIMLEKGTRGTINTSVWIISLMCWMRCLVIWTIEFPAQRPVTRSFDVFFDLRLNKRLSKQWWSW